MAKLIMSPTLSWRIPLSRFELRKGIHAILETIGKPSAALTLSLVDDEEIAELNAEHLDCHGPTNILSFPASTDGNSEDLGWLALSIDTLERETRLYGQDFIEHTFRLLAHGTLHLAGYDHGEEMYSLTDEAVVAAFAALNMPLSMSQL